ncbi:MAG: Ig-like domain-containing protein, partial [Candidatus Poribacteria bacterium]
MTRRRFIYLVVILVVLSYSLCAFTSNAQDDYSFVLSWPKEPSFKNPEGIEADNSGNIYVVDYGNSCIQKFGTNGNLLQIWGGYGSDDGEFIFPRGITTDAFGNVYVADTGNYRIQKFDSKGRFLTKWGTQGSGNGQFSRPQGIAMDKFGNVYVADSGNNLRIQKFDSDGRFMTMWDVTARLGDPTKNPIYIPAIPYDLAVDGAGNVYVVTFGNFVIKYSSQGAYLDVWYLYDYPVSSLAARSIATDKSGNVYVVGKYKDIIWKFSPNGDLLMKWGVSGTGDGQFLLPAGITIDQFGNVYITDFDNHYVQKFDQNGSFLARWGIHNAANGYLRMPLGLTVDNSGNIYVADGLNSRVQKFDLEGRFLSKWGTEGVDNGQFNAPTDVAADNSGNIYVSDLLIDRIQKFDSNGTFLMKWGTTGSGDGQFDGIFAIAVDKFGNVYVADEGNKRIQKFDSNGKFLTKWGAEGSGDGQFVQPEGIAVDKMGNVYVTDATNNCVQRFDSDGNFINRWGTSGDHDGQFYVPGGVAVDSSGNVYLVDTYNFRVQKFTPKGVFLAKWGTNGSDDGQFITPMGIELDKQGNVYVSDHTLNRIQKFAPPANKPPVISNIPDQTIDEGGTFTAIKLDDFVFDTDNTDTEMTWTFTGNTKITINIDTNRVASIKVSDTEWNGNETITFTAKDPGGLAASFSTKFTVNSVNDPPIVSDIPDQTVEEGKPFTSIKLDDYVTDPDNTDAEIVWSFSGNTNITNTVGADRIAVIATKNAEWNGNETVTFTAKDPGGLSASDTAKFTVTPINDPPVVSNIPDQTVEEGKAFANIKLDDFVTDPDNTDAEIKWTVTGNTNITVTIGVDRVATIGVKDAEWNGNETITFTAKDPGGLSASDTAKFTITPVNDPPVVSDIPDQTIEEGKAFANIKLDDFVTDLDNKDEELKWTYSGNTKLSITVDNNRVVTIASSDPKWSGNETVTFTVTDPGGLSASDTVKFTITPINDPPVASDIPDQTVEEGKPFASVKLDDFVADPDNTDAEITWSVTGNVNVTVTIGVDRVAIIGVKDAEWNGNETITFTAKDPGGLSASDSAKFTVTPINDPPVVSDIKDQTVEEGKPFASVKLDDFVTDPDNTDAEIK